MFSGLTASLACVVSSANITFDTAESTTGIQPKKLQLLCMRVVHRSVVFQWCNGHHSALIRHHLTLLYCVVRCHVLTRKGCMNFQITTCQRKSATLQSDVLYFVSLLIVFKDRLQWEQLGFRDGLHLMGLGCCCYCVVFVVLLSVSHLHIP